MVNSKAIIDKDSKIGESVTINPYTMIESGVTITKGCNLAAHVIVRKGTTLAENVFIDSFSGIGKLLQSKNNGFDPETSSGVVIKKGTVIREYLTLHRTTLEGNNTIIGENSFWMGSSHAADDSQIGDQVVLKNGVLLGDFTNIEGGGAL